MHFEFILNTFEAFDTPMVLDKGDKQYAYDIDGNKYIDLLGQNLCISVGYNRSRINNTVFSQMEKLQHATTMYYNEQSCSLAKELVEKIAEIVKMNGLRIQDTGYLSNKTNDMEN